MASNSNKSIGDSRLPPRGHDDRMPDPTAIEDQCDGDRTAELTPSMPPRVIAVPMSPVAQRVTQVIGDETHALISVMPGALPSPEDLKKQGPQHVPGVVWQRLRFELGDRELNITDTQDLRVGLGYIALKVSQENTGAPYGQLAFIFIRELNLDPPDDMVMTADQILEPLLRKWGLSEENIKGITNILYSEHA